MQTNKGGFVLCILEKSRHPWYFKSYFAVRQVIAQITAYANINIHFVAFVPKENEF